MDLTQENKSKLESKGLCLFGGASMHSARYTVFKPKEVAGNSIRDWESIPIITGWDSRSRVTEEYISNSPPLTLWWHGKDPWEVSLNQWVPGPGPGDFREEFESQEHAVEFILSYYFGENKYFREALNDINLRRNALRKEEMKRIFDAVLDSIEECFPQVEIDFETDLYKKVPIESWPGFLFRGGLSEYSVFKFELGMLSTDAHRLKEIVYNEEACTPAHWEKLSYVLLELSRLAKEKGDTTVEP
jgi:hypothetical protein